MGITAANYKIYNNKINLDNVYINVRGISTDKEDIRDPNSSTNYIFSFTGQVLLDNTRVDIIRVHFKQSTPITENLWDKAYTLLKEKLTTQSVSFEDNI